MKKSLITILTCALVTASPAWAMAGERAAESILKAMSDYIGRQKTIKLSFDSSIEVITPQLEKIQFTSSGNAVLSRPDRLRAHRISGHTDVEMFFNGKTVSIYEKNINGLARFDAEGGTDKLINALREGHGIALPAADLLLSNSHKVLMEGVLESRHMGKAIIDGKKCEHLAFRNFDTDWQLWVETGDNPVPRKMVITSKTINCAPQYTVHIREWKTGITPPPETYSFKAPPGAVELDPHDLIALDELPPDSGKGVNR